jgi:pilus assembly protein CpaE
LTQEDALLRLINGGKAKILQLLIKLTIKTKPQVVKELNMFDPLHENQGKEEILFIPRVSIQAFCESHEASSLVQNATSDRRMSKAQLRVQMGGIDAAIEAYRESPTPNLIILETSAQKQNFLESLDQLAHYCDEGTRLLVMGRINDIMFYRTLIAKGVSDYLVLPMQTVDLVQALGRVYAGADSKPLGKIYGFMGVRGGVGASSIAQNFASTLSRDLARNTCLVDLDLAFGTAGLNFNHDPPPGMSELLLSPERIDDAVVDRLLSKVSERLTMLSALAALDRTYDTSPEAIEHTLDSLRKAVPYIVLDIPHSWSGATRKSLLTADEIIFVATPDLASLRNLKNLMETLHSARPNDKKPSYILNQAGVAKRPDIRVEDFARAIEQDPIAVLNFEPQIFGTAANNGQMLSDVEPKHPINMQILELTQVITGQKEVEKQNKGNEFMNQFAPFLDKINALRKRA